MKCPACHAASLDHRRDRVTGKVVRQSGKLVMRCLSCGEVFILKRAEVRQLSGRPAPASKLAWAVGALGVVTTGLFVCLQLMAEGGFASGRTALYVALAFPFIGCLWFGLRAFLLSTRVSSPRDKLNQAAVGVFFLAFAAALAYMIVHTIRQGKL